MKQDVDSSQNMAFDVGVLWIVCADNTCSFCADCQADCLALTKLKTGLLNKTENTIKIMLTV